MHFRRSLGASAAPFRSGCGRCQRGHGAVGTHWGVKPSWLGYVTRGPLRHLWHCSGSSCFRVWHPGPAFLDEVIAGWGRASCRTRLRRKRRVACVWRAPLALPLPLPRPSRASTRRKKSKAGKSAEVVLYQIAEGGWFLKQGLRFADSNNQENGRQLTRDLWALHLSPPPRVFSEFLFCVRVPSSTPRSRFQVLVPKSTFQVLVLNPGH